MRRFFFNQPDLLQIGKELPVTEDIFHHWCKVLRATIGEQAIVFDGEGGEYSVTLQTVTKKTAIIRVDDYHPINRNLPFQVHIGLVMSRGERMDYAIQKATELGVSSIQLLTSQHGEVRLKTDQIDKKLAHWQQVAISACEQCGLNIVPSIYPPLTFMEWIQRKRQLDEQISLTKLILAVPNNENDVHATPIKSANSMAGRDCFDYILKQFQQSSNPVFELLIGAEGGFTDLEIAEALQQGYMPWQIGERVLRTETAPVVALSSLFTLYQTSTFR